jgi:hypothetical protein
VAVRGIRDGGRVVLSTSTVRALSLMKFILDRSGLGHTF